MPPADRMLPIGPLQLWVWRQQAERGLSQKLLAERLGTSPRTLERWAVQRSVGEGVVDRLLTRFGESLSDVYPEAILDASSRSRSVLAWLALAFDALPDRDGRGLARCSWGGGCREPGVVAGRFSVFCEEHWEVLVGVRAEFRAEGESMHGGRTLEDARRNRGRRTGRPQCCAPDCVEPRPSGERYCAACRDEGWSEEEAA